MKKEKINTKVMYTYKRYNPSEQANSLQNNIYVFFSLHYQIILEVISHRWTFKAEVSSLWAENCGRSLFLSKCPELDHNKLWHKGALSNNLCTS